MLGHLKAEKRMFEKKKRNLVRGLFDRLAGAAAAEEGSLERSARHFYTFSLSTCPFSKIQNVKKYLLAFLQIHFELEMNAFYI